MTRWKPTAPQLAVLRAIAAGGAWEWDGPRYTDRNHQILHAASVRRLIREECVEVGEHVRIPSLGSIQHHKPVRLTVLGESVLAAYMPGAVARAFMGEEQA